MTEEWRPIVGYEKYYEVSNYGRVCGLDRTHLWRCKQGFITSRTISGKILASRPGSNFYHRVNLSRNDGRNPIDMQVHRLVAVAFIPNPSNKKTVNHKDFDKSNNHVDNLEWLSQRENNAHASLNGRRPGGVTNKKALLVRKMYKTGKYTQTEIAKRYDMSKPAIWKIIHRLSYKYI